MAAKSSIRVLAVALAALATAETPAPQQSYAGVQALVVAGAHRDVAGSQYGVGAGPLLQFHLVRDRFALHVEGIPVVSIPGTRPSVMYGQATPKLGIFNGQFEYATAQNRRLWLGLGETVYNQRTPLPAQNQEVSSRLAGVRYTVRYRRAMHARRFVEALFGAAPTLTGSDVYRYGDGVTPNVIKQERASEVDASLALGYVRRTSEWLVGIRTVNFAARFTATGEAADRNVGVGPMIEWRRILP